MRFTKSLAFATVAAVLGATGVSVAGAVTSSGSPMPVVASTTAAATPSSGLPTTATGAAAVPKKAKAARAKVRRRRLRHAAVMAAKTIGIPTADLVQELRTGKTVAEVATAHGVQPQAVIQALEAAATAKINAAEAAHKITPVRAARLEHRAVTLIPKLVNDWHLRPHAGTGAPKTKAGAKA